MAIPREIGNLPSKFVCATRRVEGTAVVLASDAAENTERERNQKQNKKNDADGSKRESDRRVLGNGNEV